MKSARPHAGNTLPSKVSSIAPIVRSNHHMMSGDRPDCQYRRWISAIRPVLLDAKPIPPPEADGAVKRPHGPTQQGYVRFTNCRAEVPSHSCSLHQSDKGEPTAVASPGRLRTAPDPTSGPAPRRSRASIRDEGRLTALAVQGQTWRVSLLQTVPDPIQRDRSGSQGTFSFSPAAGARLQFAAAHRNRVRDAHCRPRERNTTSAWTRKFGTARCSWSLWHPRAGTIHAVMIR